MSKQVDEIEQTVDTLVEELKEHASDSDRHVTPLLMKFLEKQFEVLTASVGSIQQTLNKYEK